jgi:RimJ/RimL family protein N-acetyltransferase
VIVTGPAVVEWVAKRTNEHGNFGAATGIGVEREGKLIGGVVYNEWNGVNCNMHVAAENGHWLSRTALWYFFDYPFNQLKVNRVTGLVGEGNLHAREFDEKVGFSLETTLKGAHPTGDMLVYVMWRKDCRWLNLERPKDEQRKAA